MATRSTYRLHSETKSSQWHAACTPGSIVQHQSVNLIARHLPSGVTVEFSAQSRRDNMKSILVKGIATGVLLSAMFGGVAAINCGASPEPSTKTINWSASDSTQESPQSVTAHNYAKSLSNAFRGASEKVLPAVVTIQSFSNRSAKSLQQGNLPEELKDHPFFKDFFGNQNTFPPESHGRSQKTGMGSGVIVDSSGIILTNSHVVNDADTLKIKLHDGRQFEATEWKTDPKTDIAVVRIPTASGHARRKATHAGRSCGNDATQFGGARTTNC